VTWTFNSELKEVCLSLLTYTTKSNSLSWGSIVYSTSCTCSALCWLFKLLWGQVCLGLHFIHLQWMKCVRHKDNKYCFCIIEISYSINIYLTCFLILQCMNYLLLFCTSVRIKLCSCQRWHHCILWQLINHFHRFFHCIVKSK
jgi:hypothetical protein